MKGHAVELIKCPHGGFHDFRPVWEWTKHGFDFFEITCTKCGEGESK